ncbi:MAG TPA: hypothetical protein VKA46_08660 [Gemmataceae bacterium]|nr:hypothetical protein [Gemmataceae bacterium]
MMLAKQNEFEALAQRVERGDASAAPELRRLLEGALRPVVRRALRGGGTSALDHRIRDVAQRVGAGPERADALTALTGASLSARVVGRLRAGADSVHAGYETVVV